jgi:hypothetical protein
LPRSAISKGLRRMPETRLASTSLKPDNSIDETLVDADL